MTTSLDSRPTADVDWTNAPAGARWWSVSRDGQAYWHIMAVCDETVEFISADTWPAPMFDFDGDWRESLVERPSAEMASSRHRLLRAAQSPLHCWNENAFAQET